MIKPVARLDDERLLSPMPFTYVARPFGIQFKSVEVQAIEELRCARLKIQGPSAKDELNKFHSLLFFSFTRRGFFFKRASHSSRDLRYQNFTNRSRFLSNRVKEFFKT